MKLFKIITFALFIFFFSCNTIENPLKETNDNTCGDENDPVPIRKILVEDYTAHKCVFCPAAADILQEITDKYCDHIVPVGIHVGFLAEPDEDFPADYRTDAGNELDNEFNISAGLPKGMVNRIEYEGNILLASSNWETVVNLLYNLKPEVDISIESSYNENTHTVTATITAEYLSDINYDMNIGLYVTEDSIISPQKNGVTTVEDYVHRHVLRKGITGAFGENFVTSAKFGDIIEKTFIFNTNAEWNINHCELVAFISNGSTNEIIQAESEHIVQN
ncbi:MAG: Omp28 family outer membrane lipoprotein [Bacteroidales bacterium]|nr:Omp28 family outer membrane lipoprotein [Bacteroidales bacterium]